MCSTEVDGEFCSRSEVPEVDEEDRIKHVQWNLSNTDTVGPIECVLIREVSSFQGAKIHIFI